MIKLLKQNVPFAQNKRTDKKIFLIVTKNIYF